MTDELKKQIERLKEMQYPETNNVLQGIKISLEAVENKLQNGCRFVIPVVENKQLVKTILCGRDELCPSCQNHLQTIKECKEKLG